MPDPKPDPTIWLSVPSQSSRLVSFQNKPTENPTTNPYSHHDATEKVEELAPFRAVASSNGALPTPSRSGVE